MTASGMENGVMFMLMAVSSATLWRGGATPLGPLALAALGCRARRVSSSRACSR